MRIHDETFARVNLEINSQLLKNRAKEERSSDFLFPSSVIFDISQ